VTRRRESPIRDDALLAEVGLDVLTAIKREGFRHPRERRKVIRQRARQALGIPKGPTRTPPRDVAHVVRSPRPPVAQPSVAANPPQLPRPVPGERVCHRCLKEDAERRDSWAKELMSRGNSLGAGREAAEAQRLRALMNGANTPYRFHDRKPRQRRQATPEPSVRPPGIFELEREQAS